MQSMDSEAFGSLTRMICGDSSEVSIQTFLKEQDQKRCLKNLKGSVEKTKRALRSNNLEALATLRREFEQAEILLE